VSSGPILVLTVDDHALLRKGMVGLVNAESDMKVVAEASTGLEATKQFKQHRPDVTLMDLQLPDMSGIETMITIRQEFPEAGIIVLTTYAGDAPVVRALKAGARGYLLKAEVNDELLNTIRSVHAGKRWIQPELAAELAEYTGREALTVREIEVLRLIATGNTNKEIGARLFIGEDTVKRHVTNILGKLDANDRTHAVTIALKRGIIEL
jgi:DNA-binding NarL/FixJ family response regulator